MKLDYFGYRKAPEKDLRPPVAAVVGKEPHLRRLIVDDLLGRALGEADRSLNLIDRDLAAGTVEIASILDDLRTPTLLGGARVVHLRGLGSIDKEGRSALEGYVARPATGAALILEGDSLPANTRLFKAIAKGGLVVQCRPLYATPPPWGRGGGETEVARWIQLRVRDRGKKIRSDAVDAAVEAWGADLASIDRALEAAALLVADAPEIGVAEIRSLAPESRTDPVYKVVDATLAGDRADAMRRLRSLLLHGLSEPSGRRTEATGVAHILLRGIHRKLSTIGSAHHLRSEGLADERILEELGVTRFLARGFWSQVEANPAETIRERLGEVLRAERSIKTGEADPLAAAEALVVRLTR